MEIDCIRSYWNAGPKSKFAIFCLFISFDLMFIRLYAFVLGVCMNATMHTQQANRIFFWTNACVFNVYLKVNKLRTFKSMVVMIRENASYVQQ